MKHIKNLILLGVAFVSLAAVTNAQHEGTEEPQQQESRRPADQPQNFRNNVLGQLGLSSEQMQQIRKINMERRVQMENARLRLHQANRALDEAIYADQVNDADVLLKIAEVNTAQGEVAKLRFQNELAVRRVLTPEQLTRFRELRRQFEERRREFKDEQVPGRRRFRRQQQRDGQQPGGAQPNQQPPNF